MNELEFQNILKEKGIEVSEHQLQQFQKYYEILVEWNEKMNLTAITDKEDVYLKHFYDSITIAFDYDFNNQTLIDVGAGAGFPSVPLKILYPNLKITIVDSLNKRINFLTLVSNELNLSNTVCVHGRAGFGRADLPGRSPLWACRAASDGRKPNSVRFLLADVFGAAGRCETVYPGR